MYGTRNSYENLKNLPYTKYSKAVATTNLLPERLPPTSKAAVHHSSNHAVVKFRHNDNESY